MRRKRLLALCAAAMIFVPGFGAALSTDEVEVHVGMYAVGDWTGGTDGLVYPLFLFGASTVLDLDALPAPWVLGLGLDFLGAWYQWDDANRRAFVADSVDLSFFTVGMLVSPRIGTRFVLGEKVAMGAFAGMDLLIRFPVSPFSGVSIADEQVPALLYFIAGRFLYPEIGAWLTWAATEDVELALGLRSLWPVYRIWSPEVTGWSTFLHEVIFAGTLGMTVKLGNAVTIGKSAEEPAPPETEPDAEPAAEPAAP